MALRGKAPGKVEKRLKALFYGPAGVGKTTAAIQFPRPYLIDTEKGAENDQYVKMLNAAGGAYFGTNDPDDMIREVLSLLSEKHDYRTLIIDPLTVIYNDLLDKAADEVGTDFGKHKGPADRKIKHLLGLLLRLDMNVIITSHAKTRWERTKDAKGKDTVVEAGMTFDCYGRLDYLFDLVFEITKRGKERVGTVRKSRIETFPEGDVFPFSYDEIAERYGRSILERDAMPTVLADAAQVAEAVRLVGVLNIGHDVVAKWFDKAGAESWGEMPAESTAKCIEWMNGRVKGTEMTA
jgi:DNA polymerase III delta prime subunit